MPKNIKTNILSRVDITFWISVHMNLFS